MMQPLDDDNWRRSSADSPEMEEVVIQRESSVGTVAATGLMQGGDERAGEALGMALGDEDWRVRGAAVQALGRSEAAEAVEPLMAALRDEESQVRFYAAWALWQLADARAVEPLCAALGDGVAEVRSAAAFALGRLGDVRAVWPLCRMVTGNDRPVRFAAAMGLWEIGNATTLPVRILAATTLTPSQKLCALEELAQVQYVMASSRGRKEEISYPFGGAAVLCERLCCRSDTEAEVREGAQAVLAELRNRAEARLLLRATGREETQERQELLRSVSDGSEPTPPDELLRPAELAHAPSPERRQGLLARLFRRH